MTIAESIDALIELQKIDSGIDGLEKAIRESQAHLEANAAQLKAVEEKLSLEKKKQEDLLKQRKALEIEVGTQDQKISKYQEQTNEVKNNEQYNALKHEIETAKETKAKAEEKVLETLFREDELKASIKALTAQVAQDRGKLEDEKKAIEAKIGDCRKAIGEKQEQRQAPASRADVEELRTYEGLRKSGKKLAVAAVTEEENCEGCSMNVPAQILIEARKREQLVRCTCGRILYTKD